MAGLSTPSGQNHQKQSEGVRVFVNSALKLQCRIVKNTLLLGIIWASSPEYHMIF